MSQAIETVAAQTSEARAEQVVRAVFEALGRRDPAAMHGYYSPDVVEDVVPIGVFRGPDEVVAFFEQVLAAIPDLETSISRLVPGEREVAVEWRMAGTFSGAPFLGIDPTGRRIELRGLDLFEVEGGLIVGNTGYYDGAEFARQVGLMPALDSGAERALKGAFNAVTKVRKAIDERTGA